MDLPGELGLKDVAWPGTLYVEFQMGRARTESEKYIPTLRTQIETPRKSALCVNIL